MSSGSAVEALLQELRVQVYLFAKSAERFSLAMLVSEQVILFSSEYVDNSDISLWSVQRGGVTVSLSTLFWRLSVSAVAASK